MAHGEGGNSRTTVGSSSKARHVHTQRNTQKAGALYGASGAVNTSQIEDSKHERNKLEIELEQAQREGPPIGIAYGALQR